MVRYIIITYNLKFIAKFAYFHNYSLVLMYSFRTYTTEYLTFRSCPFGGLVLLWLPIHCWFYKKILSYHILRPQGVVVFIIFLY